MLRVLLVVVAGAVVTAEKWGDVMPVLTNDDAENFDLSPTDFGRIIPPDVQRQAIGFLNETGIPFIIKKIAAAPVEGGLEALGGVAAGIKKAPAIITAEQVISETAGAGEEAAIAAANEQHFAVVNTLAAVRAASVLVGGSGSALNLILRDP